MTYAQNKKKIKDMIMHMDGKYTMIEGFRSLSLCRQ